MVLRTIQMKKLFNNILVPVDPENDNGIAVGEAINMANQLQCNIHLLYFQQGRKMPEEEIFDLLKEDMQNRLPLPACYRRSFPADTRQAWALPKRASSNTMAVMRSTWCSLAGTRERCGHYCADADR